VDDLSKYVGNITNPFRSEYLIKEGMQPIVELILPFNIISKFKLGRREMFWIRSLSDLRYRFRDKGIKRVSIRVLKF
jgi:hypothetical protein